MTILVEGVGDWTRTRFRGHTENQHRGVPQQLGHAFSHSAAWGVVHVPQQRIHRRAPQQLLHPNLQTRLRLPIFGGSPSQSTVGMNFIPPISCGMPNEVDEIPSIQNIGNTSYTGRCCHHGSRGQPHHRRCPASRSRPRRRFSRWETYRILNLTGDITVESTGRSPLACSAPVPMPDGRATIRVFT